jgi:hypothetical protein
MSAWDGKDSLAGVLGDSVADRSACADGLIAGQLLAAAHGLCLVGCLLRGLDGCLLGGLESSLLGGLENMLLIPICYNAELNTKFNIELSKAGFNFIKDLFPNTELLSLNEPIVTQLRPVKRRQLIQIILRIPEWLGNEIENSPTLCRAVLPSQTINLNTSWAEQSHTRDFHRVFL